MSAASSRRQRVDSICHAALELPSMAREAFLREACGGDDEIRGEVEALLARESEAERFLTESVGEIAARVIDAPSPSTQMTLEPGTRLGAYEVLALLGAGGMGEVYRARDHTLGRDVALKVLRDRENDDTTHRDRLLREARRAAPLSHPGICQVFHVGESQTGPFMVMELVGGPTLHAVLHSSPMPVDEVCRVGREIAEALEHAHAHGIVHRDLKSANVMLTRDGRAKVLDFGLAARLPGSDVEGTLSAGTVALAGTLPYMAPEVLRGETADIASDIWALGAVLYEMLTGRLPFDRATTSEAIAAILRDAPAPLPSDTPARVTDLVWRCLSKDPSKRPSRAGEVALALNAASAARRIVSPTPLRSPWNRTRSVAALAGLAIAIVGAAWLGWKRSTPGTERPPRLQKAVQVTSAAGVEEYPAWSPDGRTIAYSASASGYHGLDWDIWVTQSGGSPVNRTADHAGRDLFPSWSPDGSQIAFWSDRDGGGCYVMPAVGGSARRVATATLIDPNPPQWSSDGRELSCVVGTAQQVELVTFSVSTGESMRRLPLPADGRRTFVSAAPDWSRVAMIVSSSGLDADVTQLVVVDSNTGTVVPLTDGRTRVWSPSWSPDGTALYFVSNADGSSDEWQQLFDTAGKPLGAPRAVSSGIGMRNAALSRDGSKLAYSQGRRVANVWRAPIFTERRATWADARQITFDQAYIEFADVSRDGQRLAVSSDRSGNFDLWVLPSAGGEMHQVTSDSGPEWSPRWSPDGQTFVFYSLRSGNRDIWTIPVTGGPWKQLTSNPGEDLIPFWSPDGQEVAHLSVRMGVITVWVTRVDGGEGREIARAVSSGQWSPDGQMIAFFVDGHLARRNSSGQGETFVLTQGTAASNGRWAPDGTRLYFIGGDDLLGDIYTVRVDGTGEHALTDFTSRRGVLVANSLATDGKYLYFSWQEDLGDLWIAELAH